MTDKTIYRLLKFTVVVLAALCLLCLLAIFFRR